MNNMQYHKKPSKLYIAATLALGLAGCTSTQTSDLEKKVNRAPIVEKAKWPEPYVVGKPQASDLAPIIGDEADDLEDLEDEDIVILGQPSLWGRVRPIMMPVSDEFRAKALGKFKDNDYMLPRRTVDLEQGKLAYEFQGVMGIDGQKYDFLAREGELITLWKKRKTYLIKKNPNGVDVIKELFDCLADHRPAPDQRRFGINHQAHGDNLQTKFRDRFDFIVDQVGTAFQSQQGLRRGTVNVGIHESHLASCAFEAIGKRHGNRAFTDAAFTRSHRDNAFRRNANLPYFFRWPVMRHNFDADILPSGKSPTQSLLNEVFRLVP